MSSHDKYLDTADLAARWRMSANTLRNWRHRGIGPPYVKLGGRRSKALYLLSEIMRYEQEHSVGRAPAKDE